MRSSKSILSRLRAGRRRCCLGIPVGDTTDMNSRLSVRIFESGVEGARASVNERERGVIALSTFGGVGCVMLAARTRTGSPSGASAIDST